MPTQDQIDVTNAVLKELFDLWDSRAHLYREVLYSSALLRQHDGIWRNIFTSFQPLHKCEWRNTSLSADYGDFKMAQGLVSIQQTKDVLTELAERGQMLLPNQPAVELHATLHWNSSRNFWQGDTRNYPVYFPFFEYRFNIEMSYKARPPHRIVWAPELPLYPSARVAIEDLFHTRLGDDSSYEGVLSALAPDFRGKISAIRLVSNGVMVQVVSLAGASIQDLEGKLYCEGEYGNRITADLEFDEKGEAFAATSGFPRHLLVVVQSKTARDLIDTRDFDAGSPYLPQDLTIEETEQNVENLVRGGESDTIEFKSQIPPRQEAIAITAVAFANRKGGRILVGVENDGQIVGCFGQNVKDTLTNILRDRCEPPVEFAINETAVAGKPVFVVTIPEGKDKPYQVNGKGFYLRTAGTNRLVTRYELDELYRAKPSPAPWSTA